MAGANIRLEWDDSQLLAVLQGLEAFGLEAMQASANDIGEHLLKTTQDRQKSEIDPEGVPWLELSPKYKAWKEKKRPGVKKLVFDFHMLGDQLAYDVDALGFIFGTGAVYGATHQFGRGPVPARPWLGLTPDDGKEIEAIVADHEEKAIREAIWRRTFVKE